jgi:pilus assembly protein Flp/PilA
LFKQEIVMSKLLSRFMRTESGATAVEYGLIAALIGVVIIAGAGALGSALNDKFTNIGSTVSTAGAAT